MARAFSQLAIELRQNTRLRLGIGVIIVILLTYAALALNDYNNQLQQSYYEALNEFNRLQVIAEQAQWTEHATQAQELLTQLEARLWQADTQGLAQATFQKWFNSQINSLRIGNARLKVDPAIAVQDRSLWQVTAQLEGEFELRKLSALLLAIAESVQLTVTERLEIVPTRTKPKFTLILTAYFQAITNS